MQWKWRNIDLFNGVRLEKQERVKLVFDFYEEDETLQEEYFLAIYHRNCFDFFGYSKENFLPLHKDSKLIC